MPGTSITLVAYLLPLTSALGLAWAQPASVTKGIELFHSGKYAEAAALLERQSDSPYQRTFLALSRAATGGCERAQPVLSRQFANEKDPGLRRLSGLGLVQCQVAAGRLDDAYPIVARLRVLYPSDADVLYQSARLHMKAWNDNVYQLFQNAPASYRVNQLSAEIFELQGKYAEAVAEYRKAIEKNSSAVNLHYRLGRALLMESHSTEALAAARKEFEAELALNPADAVAEYQVAQILAAEQKHEESVTRMERAVALSPEFPEALVALAKVRLREKRNDDAIALLERAVKVQPASEAAHYNLMLAYRNAGRSEDALRQKAALEKLQKPPEGEFTDFLRKLGEKPKQP